MVHPWNEPMAGVVDIHSWGEFETLVDDIAEDRGGIRGA
jgi:hypothetical protein